MSATLRVTRPSKNCAAPGPANRSRPMCETSNSPAAVRLAVCSATIDEYCTGIDQPAKSTIRPPWATCQSASGVFARYEVTDQHSGRGLVATNERAGPLAALSGPLVATIAVKNARSRCQERRNDRGILLPDNAFARG